MGPSHLVGRAAERDLLNGCAARAAGGEPSAVCLHGEPGIGKTRLVTEVVEGLSETHQVLWARFPRFSSDATAFLPVAQALSRWARTVPEPARGAAFAGADDLAAILPEFGPSRSVDGGRLTALLGTVIHRIGEAGPVILVADDLQWADSSSLDLLAYLIAGFGPQQYLTILATYRDTELAAGHRLNAWIADMRRMPRVTVRDLDRLSRAETIDLVQELGAKAGRGADGPDAEAIFERSLGNPYLTELLAVDPDMDGTSLEDALLASWHRLGPASRTLTQIVAIGGRPAPLDVLLALAGGSGLDRATALAGIESAVAAGLVVVPSGAIWFRHPLVAEVVAETVPEPAAAAWHEDYVRVLERATALPDHARAALLALHHEAAGHDDDAFRWSIAAADAAATVRATAEESENLLRAVRLWSDVDPAVRATVGDHAAVLERASLAADRAGQFSTAQRLAEEAVAAVDRDAEPRRAARMLITLPLGLDAKDRFDEILARADTAHELALRGGPSDVLALAVANRAFAELWRAVPGAAEHAETAIGLAEESGAPVAIAVAHLVHSQFHWSSPHGAAEALEAWELLRQHGDVLDWGLRNMMVLNCLEGIGKYDSLIDQGQRVLRDLTIAGAPALGAAQGTTVAHFMVRLGRWDEAREVLQAVLTQRQHPKWAVDARATAARLCAQSGDLEAARTHLARVEELLATVDPLGTYWGGARVEVSWASGDFEAALDGAIDYLPRVAEVDPDAADELALWGLRSIADRTETRPKADGSAAAGGAELDRLDAARATMPTTSEPRESEDRVHRAMAALISAERGRCLGVPNQIECWRAARETTTAAGLAWEAGWAGYQLARALLAARGHRQEAAEALRTAYRVTGRLGAAPLATRVRLLADQAHIPLSTPDAAGPDDLASGGVGGLEGLTSREREVLAHVVAGRTYAEIARDLFISPRTVGVHVSNLLRKTGTASRVELALLASRTDPGRPDPR